MDTLKLQRDKDHPDDGLRICVNGVSFREIVRKHEAAFAQAEGSPNVAGAYSELSPPSVATSLRGKPNEHDLENDQLGRITLLECECGAPGCWPLLMTISIGPSRVVWSDFEQPHRRGKWSYNGFGPFTFDSAEYEQALRNIEDIRLGPSAPSPSEHWLVVVFHRGFRDGANGRDRLEIPLGGSVEPTVPSPPRNLHADPDHDTWRLGYLTGWRMGASDRQLSGVDEPGACGLIREVGERMVLDLLRNSGLIGDRRP